ncbi:ABC transporter permease [Vallitalea longa]|uniref:ABC transporter permease n=1 Tax=Vallitalea longa TaxID=2936439 RepID=A0A9W5Y941_9FIRM|nr:ABC transporter ATP-binding protein [Vallitalea longa]GKX28814.1 ABC transporter permease [Vallitalea longa]
MNKKQSLLNNLFSLLKGERIKLFAGLILAIICSALSFVPYLAIYKIIYEYSQSGFNFSFIIYWAIISIVSVILKSLLLSIASLCTHLSAFNTMHKLRIKVIRYMSKLNLGFFNDNSQGEIKTALFDDIGRLENFIGHNLIELAQSFVVPIILFIILLIIQPIMAICILIPAVLGIFIPMKIMKGYPELTTEFANTISSVNTSVNEMVSGMPVLKMYHLSAKHFKKYTNSLSLYTTCLKKMAHKSCAPIAVTVVILDSAILFTLPIGGFLYINKMLSLGNYLLFILLSMCFFSAFFNLINIRMGIMELKSGLTHVQKILNLEPISEGTIILKKKDSYNVNFNNVSFSYSDTSVLKDVNLNIPAGSFTAFVGASGAGKTTAAQLIGRYFDVNQGEIRINDVNIKDLTTHSLMDTTAFVFQDIFIMDDTIFENIAMGSNADSSRVIEAAKGAMIHDFIMSLPKGYKTRLGDSEGIKLSGGQKQRIVIARAILKDSSIVIFDEATSFSDIENEHKIQLALSNLLKGKTTIMIAHRLHTIVNADNIVVFNEGKIAQQGTHNDLVNSRGIYSTMWNAYIHSSEKEAV